MVMVNYASNELKSKNGSGGCISERISYDPKKAVQFDLSGDDLEVKKVECTLPDGCYVEGVLINGFLCGPGKVYENGQLKYEGILINGLLYGPGKKYKDGRLEYEGGFADGEFSGYGTLYYENGSVKYDGDFAYGQFSGDGKMYDENGEIKYDGDFAYGQFSGVGKMYGDRYSFPDKIRPFYEGEFLNGRIHGKGEFVDADGNWYEGNFIDDEMVGSAMKRAKKGDVIFGTFHTGSMKELLYPVEEPKIPVLNGPATVNFDQRDLDGYHHYLAIFEPDVYYSQSRYVKTYFNNGEPTGKAYVYDRKDRLKEAYVVDSKTKNGIGIEYKYIKSRRKSREYKLENGEKKYIITNDDGVGIWSKKESPYWKIVFNPDNDKPKYLTPIQSYKLMIDILENKAQREVSIISPWISNFATEGELFNALKSALNRGVNVKIITGYGNKNKSKNRGRYIKTMRNVSLLKKKFSNCKGKLSFETAENHEKMLLCDDDFMMYGSHNLLSNDPTYTNWCDSMRCSTDPNEIRERREERFDF